MKSINIATTFSLLVAGETYTIKGKNYRYIGTGIQDAYAILLFEDTDGNLIVKYPAEARYER